MRTPKKPGVQIKDRQVETADCLIKLVALAARAAVLIMPLTQARDSARSLDAPRVVSSAKIATLDAVNAFYSRPQSNPHPNRSLAWAARISARRGGCNGRPSARPPGPITFKHGLKGLQMMAQGWERRDLYTP